MEEKIIADKQSLDSLYQELAKKIEVPKINQVVVQYNGNEKAFDSFMESMIHEFLNSCSIANAEQSDFIGNVEITKEST